MPEAHAAKQKRAKLAHSRIDVGTLAKLGGKVIATVAASEGDATAEDDGRRLDKDDEQWFMEAFELDEHLEWERPVLSSPPRAAKRQRM